MGNKAAKAATVVPVGAPQTAAQRRAALANAAEEQIELDVQWGRLAVNIHAIQEDDYADIFSSLMRVIIAYYLAKKAYSDAMAALNTRKGLSGFALEKAKGELREVRGVLRRAERKEALVRLRAELAAAADTAAAADARAARARARASAADAHAADYRAYAAQAIDDDIFAYADRETARAALSAAASSAAASAAAFASAAATAAATRLAEANARALPEKLKGEISRIVNSVSDKKGEAAASEAIKILPTALKENNFEAVVAAVETAAAAAEDTTEVAAARLLLEDAREKFDKARAATERAQAALNALAADAAAEDREDAVAEKREADEALQAAKIELDQMQGEFDRVTDTPDMAAARRELQAAQAALAAAPADQALIDAKNQAEAALDAASDPAAQAAYKREQVATLAGTNAIAAGLAPAEAFTAATERIKSDMGEMMARIGFNPDGISFLYTLVTAFFDDATPYSIAEQYTAQLAAKKFLLSGKNLRRGTLAGLLDIIVAEDFTGRIAPEVRASLDEEADLPAAQNARNIRQENISHLFQTAIKYPEFIHLHTGWNAAYSGVEGFPEMPVALEQRAILSARRVWGSILSIQNAISNKAVGRVELNERQVANQQELDSLFKAAADNIRLPNMDEIHGDVQYILLKSIVTHLENREGENIKAILAPIFKDEGAKEVIARMIIEFCKIKESTEGEVYSAFLSSTLFTLLSDTGSNQNERDIFGIAANIAQASQQLSLSKTARVSEGEIGEAERRGINTDGRLDRIVELQTDGRRHKESLRTILSALFLLCKYPTNIDNLFSGWKRLYEFRDDKGITINTKALGMSLRALLCARRVWVSITTIQNYQKGFAEELQRARGTRFASVENNPRNLQTRGEKLRQKQIQLLHAFIRMNRQIEGETENAKLAALQGQRNRLLKEIGEVFRQRTKFLEGYLELATRKQSESLVTLQRRYRELSVFIGNIHTDNINRAVDDVNTQLPSPIPYMPAAPIPGLTGRLGTAQESFRAITNGPVNLGVNQRVVPAQINVRNKRIAIQLHDTYEGYLKVYKLFIEEVAAHKNAKGMVRDIHESLAKHNRDIAVVGDIQRGRVLTNSQGNRIDFLTRLAEVIDDKDENPISEIMDTIERQKNDALEELAHYTELAAAAEAALAAPLKPAPPAKGIELERAIAEAQAAAAAAAALAPGDARVAAARAHRAALAAPAAPATPATPAAPLTVFLGPPSRNSLRPHIGIPNEINTTQAVKRALPTGPRQGPPVAAAYRVPGSVGSSAPGSVYSSRSPGSSQRSVMSGFSDGSYRPSTTRLRSVWRRGGFTRTKKSRTSRISKKYRRRLTKHKRRSYTSLKRATRNKK